MPWAVVARRIAQLSYRSPAELDLRFGRSAQIGEDPYGWEEGRSEGRFAISSYLDHHADKLARRFDANSYIVLSLAMGLFDLGRGRDGVEQALSQIYQPLTVVAIDSDRLFPLPMQQRLASGAPGASGVELINSIHGHDGFLVETDQLARIVESAPQGSSPISA